MRVSVKGTNVVLKAVKNTEKATQKEIKNAVRTIALSVESQSKRFTPVDTGALQASIDIDFQDRGLGAIVAPNMPYQWFVHEGAGSNFRYGRRPYMEKGLQFSRQVAEREMKKIGQKIGVAFSKGQRSMR